MPLKVFLTCTNLNIHFKFRVNAGNVEFAKPYLDCVAKINPKLSAEYKQTVSPTLNVSSIVVPKLHSAQPILVKQFRKSEFYTKPENDGKFKVPSGCNKA
jgi:hypothetical protein